MKHICFYFQVHQPFRLRRYRFFDIGKNHDYFDDIANGQIMRKVAQKCYLPTNAVLLQLLQEYGQQFKISFSISGTALDQFELYAPEVLDSFQSLADTGCVEYLAETNAHSLCGLKSKKEFVRQVKEHAARIKRLFGQQPRIFRNTELIYSDDIGEMVADLGFVGQLTEGAKHVLGWKSPNYLYCNARNPKLKLLLKNFRLSDDIAFRFSNRGWAEWPLTADKFVHWLDKLPVGDEIINLFMDYETFGEHQWEETGIFQFMRYLPRKILENPEYTFVAPSEAVDKLQPVGQMHAPNPISWADEERDLSAWLGNDLQFDAFDSLYELMEKVRKCENKQILQDWEYLQTSDHFYYMCTKFFSDGDVHKYFNPYETPYAAFVNYMNVLTDFTYRVEDCAAGKKKGKKKETAKSQ